MSGSRPERGLAFLGGRCSPVGKMSARQISTVASITYKTTAGFPDGKALLRESEPQRLLAETAVSLQEALIRRDL